MFDSFDHGVSHDVYSSFLVTTIRNVLPFFAFVDLKKAYDAVNHDILLPKLELYGVPDKKLKWFCSYFTKRMQCWKVNRKLSNIKAITCGVPKGTCLGPLLFIVFINDLHLHMKHWRSYVC